MTQLFTVSEVQAVTHLSRATLYKLLNSGEIRSFCPPGVRRRFVTAEALDEFVRRNDVEKVDHE